MGFGMTFDGQMAARMKAYLQRQQDTQRADQDLRQKTVAAVTAGHEHRGGQPVDRKTPQNTVAEAVRTVRDGDRYRSLMTAIGKLHDTRKSNGKPLVYVPE